MSDIDAILAHFRRCGGGDLDVEEQYERARLELAALREEVGRLKSERSDLLLLWRWGAGGKVGTGFAEVLGGDGDGETWAVRFDPMSPDDRAEFVVKITMGEDGLPVLDDAARAALAAKEEA